MSVEVCKFSIIMQVLITSCNLLNRHNCWWTVDTFLAKDKRRIEVMAPRWKLYIPINNRSSQGWCWGPPSLWHATVLSMQKSLEGISFIQFSWKLDCCFTATFKTYGEMQFLGYTPGTEGHGIHVEYPYICCNGFPCIWWMQVDSIFAW